MARYSRTAALARAAQVLHLIAVGINDRVRPVHPRTVLLDIGARGGLSRPWELLYRIGAILPVFVEPHVKAAEEISQRYPRAKIITSALWSSEDTRPLYVTAQPGCSSLLEPAPDERMPPNVKAMLATRCRVDVNTQLAHVALSSLNVVPDIIKIDVQGGELEVLRGFREILSSVQCVELEVSFMKGYRDQPLFNEIYDYLCIAGFGLFDVQVFGVANTRNAVQANAFFCRQHAASRRSERIENIFRAAAGFRYWE